MRAELFDRYGNVAYNHASGLHATFKIPSGYEKYGSTSTGAIAFVNGVASSQISVTGNPGTLYYMAEVSPGLENNSFTIADASGSTISIK